MQLLTVLVVIVAATFGWTGWRAIEKQKKITSYQIASLQLSLAEEIGQRGYLATRISALDDRVNGLPEQLRERAAILTAKDSGYGIAITEHGAFTVSMLRSEAYMDGHKVTFKIGNLSAASMNGIVLNLKYGPANPEYSDANSKLTFGEYMKICSANEAARRTISVETKKDLMPGSFTEIEVVISPADSIC